MRFAASAALVATLAIAGLTPAAAQDNSKLVAAGQKVFADQRCAMCHKAGGTGSLEDVGNKYNDEELRQWLINTRVMTEKTKSTRKPVMPAYTKLTKDEVDGLVAYMKTMKKAK